MNKATINNSLPAGIFGWLLLVYWFIGVLLLMLTKQGYLLMFFNSISFPLLDKFVVRIDILGHGMFALVVVVFFLLVRFYKGIHLWLCFGFVSLFTNILKWIVFLQHNRPMWHFYFDDFDRYMAVAPINYLRSFPSGHTMTAFALATVLAYWTKNRLWHVLLFTYAILISFGRIYLCQHFFVDTLWGALLGVLSAIFSKIVIDILLVRFNKVFWHKPIYKFYF